jgi:hypothetical protein
MALVTLLTITVALTLLATVGEAGNIRRFTDTNGTLHISNVEPITNPESPEKTQGLTMSGSLPGKSPTIPPAAQIAPEIPPEPELPPEAEKPAPNPAPAPDAPKSEAPGSGVRLTRPHSVEELIQEVYQAASELGQKMTSEGKPPLIQEASNPMRPASPGTGGSIVSFKDQKGITHIISRPAGEIQPPIQVAAGSAPQEKLSLPDPNISAWRQVSWPGPDLVPAGSPGTITFGSLSTAAGSLISKFRDPKGVWRITNSAPPGMAPIPALPVAHTASVSGNPGVPVLSAIRAPPAITGGQDAGSPGPVASPQTVLVRRDSRGISHIFNLAVAGLPGDRGDPMSFLGKLPPDLEPIIVEAAQMYRLPVPLILALIRNESNFVPQAISPKGAMGLMQLMPGTAAFLGVQNPFSPRENVLGGCRYFRLLLNYFQGSVPLALAAYNTGFQRVIDAGYQIPPIKETQGFVTQVMALYYLLDKLPALRL